MTFSLPAFALKRPITVMMVSFSMLILGVIAWFSMPLKFLPRVDRPFIGVLIPYPGGSPAQVEQQIAIPVEGEFRTIPGLRRIRTTSDGNGCNVSLQFDLDTDMTVATADVRDRMERLKLALPAEVDRMLIQRFSSGSIPVLAFGVFRGGNEEEFAHLVRTVMAPRLRRIEGVAEVQIHSPILEKEVLIEFDQNNLRSMNLALAPLVATLRASSLNLSVGQLTDASQKYYVRAEGEYRSLDDIAAIVVAPNGLRLRDVATVRFSARDENVHVALDGKAGLVMLIIKESEANAVSTCEGVHEELQKILADPIFEDTAVKLFFDQAQLINRALNNLFSEGIYGGIMAIIVLFCFLHRVRPTLVVSFAIPTSVVVGLVFMFFADMSLNIVTMVSLIISVGMLVDNAIVVVENTIRHRQLGEDAVTSAKSGASEVGLAIFASTATTLVVFAPMYYLETGRMSVFMEQLGLPLMVALLGSLLIALTLVPLAMSRMQEPRHANLFRRIEVMVESRPSRLGRFSKAVFGFLGRLALIQRILSLYAVCLHWSLRWRLAFLFLVGSLGALTYALPMQAVGMRDLPKLDTREITIDVKLEQNFDMTMAREVFTQIEERIEARRDALAVKNVLSFHRAAGGMIQVYLYTEEDGPLGLNPPYSTQEALEILRKDLPVRLPGGELAMSIADTGDSGSTRGITMRMRGDNTQILAEYAERFKEVMRKIEHLSDVATDLEQSKEEMRIAIDEPLADQAGVNPMVIAQTVDAALRGARMPYMKQGGREVPVWVQFREEDRKSKSNLDNVAVASATGGLLPLSQVVEYSRNPSPAAIQRVNGQNVVNLSAKTDTEDLTAIRRAVSEAVQNFYLPAGYTIEFGEELDELEDSIFSFSTTFAMAVILIYIVMAALFESYLLPLSILSTVPLSMGGALWMLYFTNMQFDTVTLIGCILMAGVIVNNGIVIVDHINNLRRANDDRAAVIVEAGCNRFRPVMMTALTTILGLVPLAMATTGGAATFSGLGRALIGGLTAGTMLTLFVVPIFYTMFDDFQRWLGSFLGSVLSLPVRRGGMAVVADPGASPSSE